MNPHTLSTLKQHFETKFASYLAHLHSPSETLLEAIRYCCRAESKRLRPLLVYACGVHLNQPLDVLDDIAIAIELIHTYSLIHDDLPAMDDDDMRRGQPSCHKAYSEATAILAGDALQSLSIQALLEAPLISPENKQKMALHLLHATGHQGMIAGQSLDMELLDSEQLDLEQLTRIHQLKTAQLLSTCIHLPLMLSQNVAPVTKRTLAQCGTLLGLGFQIQDDYLDQYGDSAKLGKMQGADLKANKKTFAYFYEKDALSALFNQHYDQAHSQLAAIEAELLLEIVNKLKSRAW